MKTVVKKSIKREIVSARKWSKEYIENMFEAIEQEDYAEAMKWASELAPIWGEIANTMSDLTGEEMR